MMKKSRYSLLRRLTTSFSAIAILVFALIGSYLYRSLSSELQKRDDIELDGKLTQLGEIIKNSTSVEDVRTSESVFHEILLSHPGLYVSILDRNGIPLIQHSEDPSIRLDPKVATGHKPRDLYTCELASIGLGRCIFGEQRLLSGEVMRIIIARSAGDRQALLRDYKFDIWTASALGAILVGLSGYWIARRGLRPIEVIGQQASNIEAHRLDERLDADHGPIELHVISISINRMLDRIEKAFNRLSQFSSDLAHDVRTPLANIISSSQVTISKKRSTEDYELLIESNIEECERLQRMIESMLFIARADNSAQHINPVAIQSRDELVKIAAYFQLAADEKKNTIVIQGDATLYADKILLRRAVGNLLSNAIAHSFSDTVIEINIVESKGYSAISVINCGPTISAEHIDKIFDRFYRIDPARHGSSKIPV